jgi:hypothetical protein
MAGQQAARRERFQLIVAVDWTRLACCSGAIVEHLICRSELQVISNSTGNRFRGDALVPLHLQRWRVNARRTSWVLVANWSLILSLGQSDVIICSVRLPQLRTRTHSP